MTSADFLLVYYFLVPLVTLTFDFQWLFAAVWLFSVLLALDHHVNFQRD